MKFFNFIKEHKDLIVFLVLSIVCFLLQYLLQKSFDSLAPAKIFTILVWYISLLIVVYLYLNYKKQIEWVNKHQAFLAILSILIPLTVFFWKESADNLKQSLQYEVRLKEENNRNNSHLQSVINDLKSNPNVVFWRDFSVNIYQQHWDYVSLTQTQDCKNLYANLSINLGTLNNMNKMRRDLILLPYNQLPLDLNKNMLEQASNTQPILSDIIGKCQKI